MTREIFTDWVVKFNNKIKLANPNRKVLLLIDNCSGHLIEKTNYSNVRLEFLPPNMTSELQPCDAGIIACLKAHYRKISKGRFLDALENYREFELFNLKNL